MFDAASAWGAMEFRILPPVATGGWAGRPSVMLTADDRAAVGRFHAGHNRRRGGPAVAALPYLESDAMFGCGAGYHHLFIDASGEVCPCDLAPLSFGSAAREPLAAIWERMAAYFPRPRRTCLMAALAGKIAATGALPLARAESETLCRRADAGLPEVSHEAGETARPDKPAVAHPSQGKAPVTDAGLPEVSHEAGETARPVRAVAHPSQGKAPVTDAGLPEVSHEAGETARPDKPAVAHPSQGKAPVTDAGLPEVYRRLFKSRK
jgi:hypothetical protein